MARQKKSSRSCQSRTINVLPTSPARRMAAKGHVPRCIDPSHESSDESENGSNRSNTLSGGLVNSEENGSGGSSNGSSDSESGVDDSENPSGTEDRHQSPMVWVFNKGLNLVLHSVDHCRMCNEFAVHYSGAKVRLDSSYYEACLARQDVIAENLKKRIEGRRSQLKGFNKGIPHLQDTLKGVREKTTEARARLDDRRKELERVRKELERARKELERARKELERARKESEEVRQDWAAKGSYPSVSKSSQRPRPSRSPSPRPHKLLRHVSKSSVISNFAVGRSDTSSLTSLTASNASSTGLRYTSRQRN
jgi:exonuclease VII small subunit